MSAIATDTRVAMLEAQVDEAGARDIYDRILAKDGSPEFAAMCALRQAPGTKNTDRIFNETQRRVLNKMDGHNRHKIYAAAQKAGISTQGKFYTGMGRYTDPLAWASTVDDAVAVAKKKGLDVSGPLTVKGAPQTDIEPKRIPLADDVARRLEQKILKEEPATAEKCRKSAKARRELRERVIEKHGRKTRKSAY